MRLWWARRWDGGDHMRPLLFLRVGTLLLGLRFGIEQYPSFTERMQGTTGVPKRWHYLFGRRLSIYAERRKR